MAHFKIGPCGCCETAPGGRFKNVQAAKLWQGVAPFGMCAGNGCLSDDPDCWPAEAAECGEKIKSSTDPTRGCYCGKPTTKYLTVQIKLHSRFWDSGDWEPLTFVLEQEWDIDITATLDRHSGLWTIGAATINHNGDTLPDGQVPWLNGFDELDYNIAGWFQTWSGSSFPDCFNCFSQMWTRETDCVPEFMDTINRYVEFYGTSNDPVFKNVDYEQSDTRRYAYFESHAWDVNGDPLTDPDGNEVPRFLWGCEIILSNAYTETQVIEDLYALSSEWSLNDDADYPWRNVLTGNPAENVAPIVTRAERLTNADFDITSISGWEGGAPALWSETGLTPWIDSGADWFISTRPADGSVQGAPDAGGHDWTASPFYENQLPATAPQITESGDEIPTRVTGAWLLNSGSVYSMQKWVESYFDHRPAHNFFRPAGVDRFRIDEEFECGWPTLLSGSNTAGDPWVIDVDWARGSSTNPGPFPDISTGTKCFYGGKVWSVTRVECNTTGYSPPGWQVGRHCTYELDFPSLMDVGDLGTATPTDFGVLRWPDAWPIVGRAAVSSATQNGASVDIVLSGDGAPYLRTNDKVEFSSVGSLGSNLTVTVTNATHFSVVGTLGSYTSGGYVKSNGAPSYTLNDESPKHTFQVRKWTLNYRDITQADHWCEAYKNEKYINPASECYLSELAVNGGAAGCITNEYYTDPYGFSRAICGTPVGSLDNLSGDFGCSTLRRNQTLNGMPREVDSFECAGGSFDSLTEASCIAITPNGDVAVGWRSYSFPGVTTMDWEFSGGWVACVVQQVVDPLWLAPHVPAVDAYDWFMDGLFPPGSGRFPFHPMIEAACSPAAGAPDLPANAYPIGCTSLSEIQALTETTRWISRCAPPSASADLDHLTYGHMCQAAQAEQYCVEHSCAWAVDYAANLVGQI